MHSHNRVLGQGMTEYIIIVALIAIAAIGVFTAFGDVARQQVAGMATELAGEQAGTNLGGEEAGQARDQGIKDAGLANFSDNFGE